MDYPGQAAGDLVAVSVNDAAACCTDCLRHEGLCAHEVFFNVYFVFGYTDKL